MEREPEANERAVADHLRTTGFEAMARSADMPSMTMTFRVRSGEAFLAGGLYRIERIRTLTDEDVASFGEYPEPLCYHCGKSDQDD